jgi:acyl carrier protein
MFKLKSFSEQDLKNLVLSVIAKQFDTSSDNISFNDNIVTKFEADSVDLVGLVLAFENIFENSSSVAFKLSTDKINDINTVNDLYNLIYSTLITIETKLNSNEVIKPNYNLLKN